MITLDTETVGLCGPIVLFQYAFDDGPIILYEPWKNKIKDTIHLFENICHEPVVGFNLAFDWFHICQMYTTLIRMSNRDSILKDCIKEYASEEEEATQGPCLKPVSALDLMLHARKTQYQSTMERGDISIRRVPTGLAYPLVEALNEKIKLKDIYFARKKDKKQWDVYDSNNIDFKNVVLKFAPSSGLKALAADALNESNITAFQEISPGIFPDEKGYAPFSRCSTWPNLIQYHIEFWSSNQEARRYAANDVDYTRKLFYHFGKPSFGDDDSILACAVGACRWKGYTLDITKLTNLADRARLFLKVGTFDPDHVPTSPKAAMEYLSPFLTQTEKAFMQGSTKKTVLEEIAEWLDDDGNEHKAASRAKKILEARQEKYNLNIYEKLLEARRFHAEFKVIGTLSGRMAGGGSRKDRNINPQGIKHSDNVRECFPLADPGFDLNLGDFDSFEVVLADAAYNDPGLRADLLSGKKIHALFAQELYPGKSYEDIIAGGKHKDSMYDKGKRGVFSLVYGGNFHTLMIKLGVSEEVAVKAEQGFLKRYPGIGRARKKINDQFCSMRQPGGIGSKVIWHEPKEYVESLLGFRRYFTLENTICRALFELANKPPKAWQKIKLQCVRRERIQTVGGALQSAVYAAAFNIQSSAMRAAANHEIQSTGAEITKYVQRKIWDLQPVGVHEWIVQPMNIHDEILCPTNPSYSTSVRNTVLETVESYRDKVPLIKIDWKNGVQSWAEK